MQQKKPIEIPINKGSLPDWQTRLGYPDLLNLFVAESGFVYSTPGLTKLSPDAQDKNARAIHYSKFGGGRYIVVTKNKVLYIGSDGGFKVISTIQNSGLDVQIDENIQNQVGIVDGKKAYVIDQKNNNAFITLGAENGFSLTTPISIAVINTITVILDRSSNTWIISDVDNMLSYPVWNPPTVDSSSTQGISLEVMNNNLFVLGTTGCERWVPNTSNSPYLFPLAKDTSYFVPFGPIGSNASCTGENEIFFLSSKYAPMVIDAQGCSPVIDRTDGLAKIISQYEDVKEVAVSFSVFREQKFVYFTFLTEQICWVYNKKSKTMHKVDDLFTDALQNYETVATPGGVYKYSLIPAHKHRSLQTELIRLYKGIYPNRQLITAFELQIIQGLIQPQDSQRMELTLSLDGLSWTNTVARPWGNTGQRNDVMTWSMNIAAQEVMYRLDYYGDTDLTISKAATYII